MRFAALCLAALPLPTFAETFTINTKATSATVYSELASVTHQLPLSLPPGAHELILPDLPPDANLDTLRVSAPGLKLGAIRIRDDLAPPRPDRDTPEILAAQDQIDVLKDQIQTVKDRAARQELAVDAAQAQLAFLTGLQNSETLPANSNALRDMAKMIGEEALAAKQTAFDAQLEMRRTLEDLENLEKGLKKAEQALAALIPTAQNRPLVVMDVVVPETLIDMPLTLTFITSATWQPTYDLRLEDGPNPQLVIERGAAVQQFSGENWEGIQLAVSTRSPSNQTDPDALRAQLRRIVDEAKFSVTARAAPRLQALDADMGSPVMEAPVIIEEATSAANFEGLSVTYSYSDPVDVANKADAVRLPFDSVTLDAELIARAIPLHHDSAFLLAKITNTTGEPLLESNQVLRFFDTVLVGASYLDTIEAGEEAEIGFGSIDGLQLTRRLLKRDAGDRGIISRSNEQTEEIEITLKNLTDRTWNVELRDRVPYSEQEDLEITYRASPEPDVMAVDDKRGVLQWNFEMPLGREIKVNTSHRITWPEGQMLRAPPSALRNRSRQPRQCAFRQPETPRSAAGPACPAR